VPVIETGDLFQEGDVWASEYARLVRLCGAFSGHVDAAEDLAQETLTEAWHHRDRLDDPDGLAPWLTAIARNVCLRWRRRHGREVKFDAVRQIQRPVGFACAGNEFADDVDLEIELERRELADLLDRAMASLPAETRTILIRRYVDDLRHGEIAARLGMSEGAVRVKLHRGKLAMRRILTRDFPDEAATYGLTQPPSTAWHETRIWCPLCGQRRFLGLLDPVDGAFELRCPDCYASTGTYTEYTSSMMFAGIAGYKATFNRAMRFVVPFYQEAITNRGLPCPNCDGGRMPLYLLPPSAAGPGTEGARGMRLHCDACQSTMTMRLSNLALYQTAAWAFWWRHPRIHLLPERSVEAEGRAALVLSYASLRGTARLDAVVAADTYEILRIDQTPGS